MYSHSKADGIAVVAVFNIKGCPETKIKPIKTPPTLATKPETGVFLLGVLRKVVYKNVSLVAVGRWKGGLPRRNIQMLLHSRYRRNIRLYEETR